MSYVSGLQAQATYLQFMFKQAKKRLFLGHFYSFLQVHDEDKAKKIESMVAGLTIYPQLVVQVDENYSSQERKQLKKATNLFKREIKAIVQSLENGEREKLYHAKQEFVDQVLGSDVGKVFDEGDSYLLKTYDRMFSFFTYSNKRKRVQELGVKEQVSETKPNKRQELEVEGPEELEEPEVSSGPKEVSVEELQQAVTLSGHRIEKILFYDKGRAIGFAKNYLQRNQINILFSFQPFFLASAQVLPNLTPCGIAANQEQFAVLSAQEREADQILMFSHAVWQYQQNSPSSVINSYQLPGRETQKFLDALTDIALNNNLLAVGNWKGELFIFNGQVPQLMPPTGHPIHAIDFQEDLLLYGGGNKKVTILKKGADALYDKIGKPLSHKRTINFINRSDNQCVTHSIDKMVKIWDLGKYKEQKTFQLDSLWGKNTIQLQGTTVMGSDGKVVEFYDIRTNSKVKHFDVDGREGRSEQEVRKALSLDIQESLLVIGTTDGIICKDVRMLN
jgi:hypothetical protein